MPEATQRKPKADGRQATDNEPAAEWVPVDSLHVWKDNPRKNDQAVPELVKSIKRFGFGAPILARKANSEIIGGHTRWKAAKKLGLERVPVRFLDLDPAEAHVLALADNKIGEIADWDEDMLAALVSQMKSEDIDLLDGTGFDEEMLEKVIARLDEDGGDAEPELGNDLGYKVVVDVADEQQQSMLIEKLEAEGFSCRPLIS